MKLHRVTFHAFGHFSGGGLDFGERPLGMHVIAGPNEAGKSTALRAITALLFGVDQQSADTFLHAGKDIRIEGEVSRGEQHLSFTRRKGRKNTLLAADGSALPDNALEPFLTGVDVHLWRTLFGLDHETLRAGAQALLAGEGALGESLFDAGSGSSSVRKILTRLRAESEELYTRKGRNKQINQQLASVMQARQLVSEQTTTATGYVQQEQGVVELRRELLQVRERGSELLAEKARSERLLRVLPLLAQRASYLEQLAELGSVPTLDHDAERRRTDTLRLLEECELKVAHERQELQRLSRSLDALRAQPDLTSVDATRVDDLSQRLGGYRKAKLDLPKREGELRAIAEEAELLVRRLGRDVALSEIESLRLSASDEARVRRLVRNKAQADTKREDCAVKIKRSSEVLSKRQRELNALPAMVNIAPLERCVMRAQKHVEQEHQLNQAKQRLADLELRLAAKDGWFLAADAALAAARLQLLPSDQALSGYERLFHQQEEAIRARRVSREQAQAKLRTLSQRRDAIQAGGEIPSERQLLELRATRDSAMQTPRGESAEVWLVRLSAAMHQADAYADRLYREASRVAQLSAIEDELAAANTWLADAERELEAHIADEQALRERWRASFAPLDVAVGDRGVSEMREWVGRFREGIAQFQEREREQLTVRRLEASLADVIAELSGELAGIGEQSRLLWESLPQFVERAELAVEGYRRSNNARKDLEQRLELERQQLTELQLESSELKEAEKLWRTEWQTALKQLGLGRDSGSEAVSETLDNLSELFRKAEEMRGLERRIAGIQRDAEDFCADVDSMVAATLPELRNMPVEEKIQAWVTSYRQAVAEARERERLTQERQQRESLLARSELEVRRHQATLDELMQRACVSSLAELVEAERRVTHHAQLQAALDQEERKILALGDGAGLESLLAQAQGAEAEPLRAGLARLEAELAEGENSKDLKHRALAAAEEVLTRMQQGAASAAEELAARNAELRSSVARYQRLRLATALLEQEIERYRSEHQGPVLGRATELFPLLTVGRYSGLKVGFDAKDAQILMCVADSGREVSVGGLSDGTRDQLYLSLRIASVERFLQRGGALPLVLDDVLIHFDDERAAAALVALGELARRTQVLFFTHHQRIVELAEQHVPAELLTIHGLPTT